MTGTFWWNTLCLAAICATSSFLQVEPVSHITCTLIVNMCGIGTCMSRVTLHYIIIENKHPATEFYFRRPCFVLAHVQMLRYYTYLLTAMSISAASSGIAPKKYTQLHDSFVLIKKCMKSINYLSLLRFSLLLPNCEGSHSALIYKFKDVNLNYLASQTWDPGITSWFNTHFRTRSVVLKVTCWYCRT